MCIRIGLRFFRMLLGLFSFCCVSLSSFDVMVLFDLMSYVAMFGCYLLEDCSLLMKDRSGGSWLGRTGRIRGRKNYTQDGFVACIHTDIYLHELNGGLSTLTSLPILRTTKRHRSKANKTIGV